MKTTLHNYTIGQILEGFEFSVAENKGSFGLNGQLTIQPEYQRNYVYNKGGMDAAVIRSTKKQLPLGMLYFERTPDQRLQVLDGQQRITSLGLYVINRLSVDNSYFSSMNKDDQQKFLNTELLAYICEGSESEIKDWFKTINSGGVKVNEQEMLNAVYSGPFVKAARKHLSNANDPQVKLRSQFISGDVRRQDHLERALMWISPDGDAESYMSKHRSDPDANDLIRRFEDIIRWAYSLFPNPDTYKAAVDWGRLHARFKDTPYDKKQIAADLLTLQADPSVTSKKGIYPFLLGGKRESDRKLLNLRCFSDQDMATAYAQQLKEAKATGLSNCPICADRNEATRTTIHERKHMDAHHDLAWSLGGETDLSNCIMYCRRHNQSIGNG